MVWKLLVKLLLKLQLWFKRFNDKHMDDKYRPGARFINFVKGTEDHQLNKRFEFIYMGEISKGDYISYLTSSHRYVIIKLIDFETIPDRDNWYKINKYVVVCLDVFPDDLTTKELNVIDLKDRVTEVV